MKFNFIDWIRRDEGRTLARFGDARLEKKLDGKIELRGGTPEDRRSEGMDLPLHARGGDHHF